MASKLNNSKEIETLKIYDFTILKAIKCKNGSIVFDIKLNGITIYGCFLVPHENGDFITFPKTPYENGKKQYSIVYAKLSEDDTSIIEDEILKIAK